MRIKWWRRWPVALVLSAVALASCGGARSVSGTSAANCVDALQRALTMAPHDDSFRGLAQLNARGMAHLGFGTIAPGQYCVIMFLNRNLSTRRRFVLELYGYTERPVYLVGHLQHVRKAPKLLDLA
ncbi:hypothetical protein [Ferrimicrobium sp.]|uniref:hypothetical protein n=1 Tax=Ferrimicrobium sp. TaxID=2926050 RepID=UPI002629C38D|nr:hypothetical protein [Ferrimicrobium sp.]